MGLENRVKYEYRGSGDWERLGGYLGRIAGFVSLTYGGYYFSENIVNQFSLQSTMVDDSVKYIGLATGAVLGLILNRICGDVGSTLGFFMDKLIGCFRKK